MALLWCHFVPPRPPDQASWMTSVPSPIEGGDSVDRIRAKYRHCGGSENPAGRWRLRPAVMVLEGRALLSSFTVENTADDGSAGTLRWAIAQANASSGADTILFSSLFDTPQTITLTKGPLVLTDTATTTITGPGANTLTVSGGGKSGVFKVSGGSAALSGLTISGGMANTFGGGLYNQGGKVTLTDCRVTQNTANEDGGGLANTDGRTLNLNHCTVAQNSLPTDAESFGRGGGLWNAGTATLTDFVSHGFRAEWAFGPVRRNPFDCLDLSALKSQHPLASQ
jgi:hypothetical protein